MNSVCLHCWLRLAIAAGFILAVILVVSGCDSASSAKKENPAEVKNGTRSSASPGKDSAKTATPPSDPSGFPDGSASAPSGLQPELRILHWNVESGGNHPPTIANQLESLVNQGDYSIVALSEVHSVEVYLDRFESMGQNGVWQAVIGESGQDNGRESDRLMILFDSSRLKLIVSQELSRHGDFHLNRGRHRSPLIAQFKDRRTNHQFILLHNHLARGNGEFRVEQAKGLREFARDTSIAGIAVGDYNFDYDFDLKKGNQGFVEMLRDNVWKWIEPDALIDTNWYDPDGDGIDNYPGSMLDFTFVAGQAKQWQVTSKVLVRQGDFPDDNATSDHRPVQVVVRYR